VRRRADPPDHSDRSRAVRGQSPIFAIAAIVVIATAVAVVIWVVGVRARHRRAAPRPEPAASVELIAPLGGIAETPRAFTWAPVPSAASYKVTIGDNDAVWPLFVRTTTASSLGLDERDAGAISAGRILMWEVLALDAAGNPVARGSARFRVRFPGEDASSEPLF
jgi:hypothetical protein